MNENIHNDSSNKAINCPNCNAVITKEMNFCPYCMEKFIQETDANNNDLIKKNKRKKAIIISAVMLLVIVIGLLLYFFVLSPSSKNDKAEEPQIDYSQYVGIWGNEPLDDEQNPYVGGSTVLIIKKIDNESVTFDIENVSPAPAFKIASLEDQCVSIENGKSYFRFANDGFNNSGKGEIRFEDKKIYMKIEITEYDEYANHSIEFDGYLILPERPVIDLVKAVGADFAEYRTSFGNGLPEENLIFEGMDEQMAEYTYNDSEVIVGINKDKIITDIFVDYTKMDDKTRYEIGYDVGTGKINGKTSYAEVSDYFPEGEYVLEEYYGEDSEKNYGAYLIEGFVGKDEGTFAKIYFSENESGTVQKIYIFVI